MANTHAATFDGTGDYAEGTSITDYPSGTAGRTIEAWIKYEGAGELTYFDYGGTGASEQFELSVDTNLVILRISGGDIQFTATGVSDGSYHHVALSYASGALSGTSVKCYLDGVEISVTGAPSGTPSTPATADIRIGADLNTTKEWDGLVDDVRIWDDVRVLREIRSFRYREIDVTSANLVGYFKLNTTFNDSHANANNLTAIGDAAFDLDPAFTQTADVANDATLPTSLVSYWELEEASGTRADSAGANTLADNNTVGQGTGIQGNCGDFEKDDIEYLDITDASQVGLDILADLSLSFWIKIETALHSAQLINKISGNSGYRLEMSASGKMTWGWGDGSFHEADDVDFFVGADIGTFVHVVMTFKAATPDIEMWHDGELQAVNVTGTGTSINNSSADFGVGASGTGFGPVDGLMDEVAIWSKVLSDQEISNLFGDGSAIPYEAVAGAGGAVGTKMHNTLINTI